MTREEALELLRRYDAIRRFNDLWRGLRPEERPDLSSADLVYSHLKNAELDGANLHDARLYRADLTEASLISADLGEAHLEASMLWGTRMGLADLRRADLSCANLSEADLAEADLSNADLQGAVLHSTNLSGAYLNDTAFDGATLGETRLIDVNLRSLCQAVELKFTGPSTIDYRSILRSAHEPRLKEFLRATGMPDDLVEVSVACAQALTAKERKSVLLSSFISYGGPDEPFASKLSEALRDQGVTTFLFKKDAEPGAKLSRVMHEGVRKHDRVILVCSEASLGRPGVLNELQETLEREAADGGAEYLLPIRLDGHVFTDWAPTRPHLAAAVRSRVVADFTDPADFQNGVTNLIRALMIPKVK